MVLPSLSNYITLSNIQNEFGGTAPIFLSEYYGGGSYVSIGVTGVPTSGYISFIHFAGKSKPAAPAGGANLVQNPAFTSTTSWTSSAGWGPNDATSLQSNSNRPTYITGDTASTYSSYLIFSYPQNQTVTQTVSLTSPKSSYTFSYQVTGKFSNNNKLDKFYGKVDFKNSSGVTVHTIGTSVYADVSSDAWVLQSFTTSIDVTSATTALITLSGYDIGFWNGNHGARFSQVSLV